MIIGSGLLARAFSNDFMHRDDVCIFAAGVSNSGCSDVREFTRERQRLIAALSEAKHVGAFVYFGTCSVLDPDAIQTPYVQHKVEMEQLVSSHERNLILRLPQVAGHTPNPHTLLNYLFARISRSESFSLWGKAKRNIIDIEDVALIARDLILDDSMRGIACNVANVINYSMSEIVSTMAIVVGKQAIYKVINKGSEYPIDVSPISAILHRRSINFGADYLEEVIAKYYDNSHYSL